MSEPFLAEIRIVGFKFAPYGWAFCNGSILPIQQNRTLYSLLGIGYGGNGRTSFGLPDMRGRTPIHMGTTDSGFVFEQGQNGGNESIALSVRQMPVHDHGLQASSSAANRSAVAGNMLARPSAGDMYSTQWTNLTLLGSGTIANAGGGQAHENMMPCIALNFCIALHGASPERN